MAFIISRNGIETAIEALSLNETTLKYKLLAAIQSHLPDDDAIQSVASISTEKLIREIWEIDDPNEIKTKRKNLSSLKSTVNKVLKKLSKEGANPEKVKESLANMNILVDDWGGKFQCQEISSKKGIFAIQ